MRNNTDARFEDLYRAHAREVHGYCLRRMSSEETKDATSEVFLVAWRRYGDVPQGDEALPCLYGVARNVLANRARSVRRRDRLAAKAAANHDPTVPGPEPQIVRNEEHAALLRALSGLPERDQEVLRLVEWEGPYQGAGGRDVLRKQGSHRQADRKGIQEDGKDAERFATRSIHDPRDC